jgi:hypothetical protein
VAFSAGGDGVRKPQLFPTTDPVPVDPMLKNGERNMTVYGYARVSIDGQTLAAQDGQLHAAGCAKVFSEKVSGAKTDRAALGKLLKRLEPRDVLVVTRLDPTWCVPPRWNGRRRASPERARRGIC